MNVWGDAIRAAREARQELGFDDREPIVDLLHAAETAGGVHVSLLELAEELAGAYARRSTGALVFVNGKHHVSRQRFTLAHELGHHWLDHPSTVDDLQALSDQTTDPCETQANVFARELLMPHHAVKQWADDSVEGLPSLDDVIHLAAHFEVSVPAARSRIYTAYVCRDHDRLQAIDAEIKEGLHHQRRHDLELADYGDSLATESRHLPRVPDALAATVLGKLIAGALDVEQAARLTGHAAATVEAALKELRLDELLPAA